MKEIYPGAHSSLNKLISFKAETFGEECSEEEICRLTSIAKEEQSEVIVGMGGGKALDTAKVVAHNLSLPVAIVPTIASTDAPCSALSVIYTSDSAFKRYQFFPKNPDLVLVDTDIIVRAPTRFLVSGMGDALATSFEAQSCAHNFKPNMTGDLTSIAALGLADLCYKTLLEFGLRAILSCQAHVTTPALEYVVEANTLLSGIGFESGGLGAAHAIHNGLTVLDNTHQYFHGEKVAIGTLASLFLTDKPQGIVDEVYTFCEHVGLPTTLKEIGLADVSNDDLFKVAEAACAEGETIHNESVPITPENVFASLVLSNDYGSHRKQH